MAFSLELGVAEFLEFARDVGVTTDAYGQPRVVAAFDAAAKRPAPESLPSRGKQLSYPDFLQLLVTVAFERDNPQYRPAEAAAAAAAAAHGRPSHGGGALPARGVEKALPGCLSSFLDDAVLPKAKRDASFSERDTLTKDEGAQLALQEASTEIEALWSSLKPEGAKGVAMGSFVERLRDGGLLGETRATRPAASTGEGAREWTLRLDARAVERAFVDSQLEWDQARRRRRRHRRRPFHHLLLHLPLTSCSPSSQAEVVLGGALAAVLDLSEFRECLLRVADTLYAPVDELDRAGRLNGLLTVLGGRGTATDVVLAATAVAPSRVPPPPSEKYNEIGVDARSDRLYMPPPAYIPCRYIRA